MSRETEHNGDASQEIADSASRYLGRPVELPTDRPSQIAARTVGNLLPFVDVLFCFPGPSSIPSS